MKTFVSNLILEIFILGCPIGYRFIEASKLCILDCKTCGANEFYKSCGTCEPTCEHPNAAACTQDCHEGENFGFFETPVKTIFMSKSILGCYCLEGFIRDAKSGLCVKKSECRSIQMK